MGSCTSQPRVWNENLKEATPFKTLTINGQGIFFFDFSKKKIVEAREAIAEDVKGIVKNAWNLRWKRWCRKCRLSLIQGYRRRGENKTLKKRI
jgi:hypothetical protein